jgi:hypothetical protein
MLGSAANTMRRKTKEMTITAPAPRRSLLFRPFRLFPLLLLLVPLPACSDLITAVLGADAGTQVDAAVPPGMTGGTPGKLSAITFTPSNFAVSALEGAAPTGDLTFDGKSCGAGQATIDTDKGTISCGELQAGRNFWYGKVKQGDGGSLGVFVTKSLSVDATMKVVATGQLPLVLVALESAEVLGTLSVTADGTRAGAGGFAAPAGVGGRQAGTGPGGGASAGMAGGAAGGGYCGKGGSAAAGANMGGGTYGAPELVPLIGGSSGGLTEGYAGAGGGAVQLVAAKALRIGALGVINAGGAGGAWRGCGGGAGGAILLEAPSVTVAGVLAANGGAGADTGYGEAQDGQPSDQPASGGTGDMAGGSGSAGTTVDGFPAPGNGGGGGGAGYIRINTMTASAAVTGKLSPAAGSACTTQGMLH